MGLIEAIMDIPAEQQSNVFGQFDAYAKNREDAPCDSDCQRGERKDYGRGF